jgi:hypothetical protein
VVGFTLIWVPLIVVPDNIVKKLVSNDKILEDINAKLDDCSSAMKDQLNHNKKVETKLAQLAAALPFATNPEQVQAITTRGGKSTRDPPYPKGTERRKTALVLPIVLEEKKDDGVEELDPPKLQLHQDFHDTNLFPFRCRNRKAKTDE